MPTTAGVGRQPPRPLRSPAEPREGQGNRVNQRNRLDALLQQRLGAVPEIGDDLSGLAELLRALALALPFDNRALLSGEAEPLVREHVTERLLSGGQGGLCYELNPLLYWLLADRGLAVCLVRGTVYDAERGDWGRTHRTHVAVLLEHGGERWLLDTGFGTHLPLRPVPLSGAPVQSSTGRFRVRAQATPHGDQVLDLWLHHRDAAWRPGYAFDSRRPVVDLTAELTEIFQTIRHSPHSPFNQGPLISRLTEDGPLTLTASSLTRWRGRRVETTPVTSESQYRELARTLFG